MTNRRDPFFSETRSIGLCTCLACTNATGSVI
jgi:hypothetical protein